MLNASYLVALDFKKRTKLFPHPFFGLSLCSAVAASCSRCAAQQPALIATRLLDEPQLCNTENQADHEKKNVFFSFPATDWFILPKPSLAASVHKAGRKESTSDDPRITGRKELCAAVSTVKGLTVVRVLPFSLADITWKLRWTPCRW